MTLYGGSSLKFSHYYSHFDSLSQWVENISVTLILHIFNTSITSVFAMFGTKLTKRCTTIYLSVVTLNLRD